MALDITANMEVINQYKNFVENKDHQEIMTLKMGVKGKELCLVKVDTFWERVKNFFMGVSTSSTKVNKIVAKTKEEYLKSKSTVDNHVKVLCERVEKLAKALATNKAELAEAKAENQRAVEAAAKNRILIMNETTDAKMESLNAKQALEQANTELEKTKLNAQLSPVVMSTGQALYKGAEVLASGVKDVASTLINGAINYYNQK